VKVRRHDGIDVELTAMILAQPRETRTSTSDLTDNSGHVGIIRTSYQLMRRGG